MKKTATPDERVAAFREIVRTKAFGKIDGCGVDLFSASTVVAVYDALNETNRAKFASLKVREMVLLAFRLAKGGA